MRMRRTHWPIVVALWAALALRSSAAAAQDLTAARQLLQQALAALEPPTITTAAALDAALAGTEPVLTLAPGFVYPTPLTVRRPVTIRSGPVTSQPLARVDKTTPLPAFKNGLTIAADSVRLSGLEVTHSNPATDIVAVQGAHVTLDGIRILGDPVKGAKRCLAANSNGDLTVTHSYLDDCFAPSPGADSQAIAAWDMGPGLHVTDTYLSGGSETVLLGGADAPADRTPDDVVFEGNTITKNPAWQALPVGVKNLVEIKNATHVTFRNNTGSYSWVNGQTGYLIVLSVRNQDGRAPWATIQDVLFEHNTWTDGGGAINLLGRDDIKETGAGRDVPVGTVRRSVPMARVTIRGDTFSVDPVKYAKLTNMKVVMVGGGPIDTTLDGLTITALSAVGSAVYWASGPPAVNFTLTNTTLPKSTYGMFSVIGGSRSFSAANVAWTKYVQSGTIATITETP